MADRTHDCTHHGHVWLETDGTPYTRHRGRTQADVTVGCQFCPKTAVLPATAKHTAPPQQAPRPVLHGAALSHLQQRIAHHGSVPKQP